MTSESHPGASEGDMANEWIDEERARNLRRLRREPHELEMAYRGLVSHVWDEGVDKPDRTDTGTRSVFGAAIEGPTRPLPLLTSKKVHFHNVKVELLWFLRGGTDVGFLREHDVGIWDDWADEDGDVGPVYGKQWRDWRIPGCKTRSGVVKHADQVRTVLKRLRDDPHSRRHVVSAWNAADLSDMALPPCHVLFQFYARPLDLGERIDVMSDRQGEALAEWQEGEGPPATESETLERLDRLGVPGLALDCHMYQRSADLFIGVPYNVASYATLTRIVAEMSREWSGPAYAPGRLRVSFGDAHVYSNHGEQVAEMLNELPRTPPSLEVDASGLDDEIEPAGLDPSDLELSGYDHGPFIEAPVAV